VGSAILRQGDAGGAVAAPAGHRPRPHHAAPELGIADRAVFAGYRVVDYAEHLAAMDFEIFPGPGSNGSCPVAREAMAMGKPVIAGHSGLLPELVEDGRCGLVVEPSVEKLAEAIIRLAQNRSLREKLGRAAAAKAKEKFDIERQAEAVADLIAAWRKEHERWIPISSSSNSG